MGFRINEILCDVIRGYYKDSDFGVRGLNLIEFIIICLSWYFILVYLVVNV